MSTRKQRGHRTQALVAGWFREHGWPYAESTGASRQGADITGMVDVGVEVKARRDVRPLAWIRQAVDAADGRLPLVVFRPDGAGEQTVESWPCLLRLEDLTRLLHEAGYGDTSVINEEAAPTPGPSAPSEPERITWLSHDWIVGDVPAGQSDHLHLAVPVADEAETLVEGEVVDQVPAACGRTLDGATIPGVLARMSLTRCPGCCDATGLPHGDGSPKNDPACRVLLGLDEEDT